MDEHEKYLFDLRGYLVVRDALTKGQLSQLSSTLESKRKSGVGILGSDRTSNNSDTELAWSSPSTLEWGGEYLNLIDLPSLQPYLEILLGKLLLKNRLNMINKGNLYFVHYILEIMQNGKNIRKLCV